MGVRCLSPGRARSGSSQKDAWNEGAAGPERPERDARTEDCGGDCDGAEDDTCDSADRKCGALGDGQSQGARNNDGRIPARSEEGGESNVGSEGGCGCMGVPARRDGWRKWAMALVMVWLQLINNYETQDQSNNYAMEHLTRTAIETLPPNAIVLCSGDLQYNPGAA